MPDGGAASIKEKPQVAWLSHGLTALVQERRWLDQDVPRDPDCPLDFDVLIVGSGYGASVAAAELGGCTDAAGRKLSICVLERGKERLAGMFPGRQANLFGHVRFATQNAGRARGVLDGLYDIRVSPDAVSVVACGLGGGSLINAGVMAKPHPSIFREARWPEAIRNDAKGERLDAYFERAKAWLEPKVITNAVREPGREPEELAKRRLLNRLGVGHECRATEVTVAGDAFTNAAGVALGRCHRCGDCATGCNKNSKNSLDVNLLRLAHSADVRIVTGATVLCLEPLKGDPAGWRVFVNHTDGHLRDRQAKPFAIHATRVILAAGTFGSTEILMRSKDVPCSAQLGRKFSANGDMLVMAYGLNQEARSVADETDDPGDNDRSPDRRAIGPTISSMIDLRTGNPETDVVIQDLAVPGSLRRAFEETTTLADVINCLASPGDELHSGSPDQPDDAAVDPQAIANSLVLAMIGRDDAEGELAMGSDEIGGEADGLLTVTWPALRLDPRFARHHEQLQGKLDKSGLGGRVISNLLWRPLSQKLENVFGDQRGPLVTVHPLGGCPMGNDVREGVTDDIGRVFNPVADDPKGTYKGLVVLDGSIVPASLGINPALTISALAWRAIGALRREWGLQGGGLSDRPRERSGDGAEAKGIPRPMFTDLATPDPPKQTKAVFTEQIRGTLHLAHTRRRVRPHEVEITITTEPVALADLMARVAGDGRKLPVTAENGRLRILREGRKFDPVSDLVDEEDVLLTAQISGALELFRLEPSERAGRIVRAFGPWLLNRGIRDLSQAMIQKLQRNFRYAPPVVRPRTSLPTYLRNMRNLLSRAGGRAHDRIQIRDPGSRIQT